MLNWMLERLGLRPRRLTEEEQRRSEEFFDRALADRRADDTNTARENCSDGRTDAEGGDSATRSSSDA